MQYTITVFPDRSGEYGDVPEVGDIFEVVEVEESRDFHWGACLTARLVQRPDRKHAYEIWSEGYNCSGSSQTAMFHGSINRATSFRDACDKFASKHPFFRDNYNRNSLTFWGCGLYDNEEDARREYG